MPDVLPCAVCGETPGLEAAESFGVKAEHAPNGIYDVRCQCFGNPAAFNADEVYDWNARQREIERGRAIERIEKHGLALIDLNRDGTWCVSLSEGPIDDNSLMSADAHGTDFASVVDAAFERRAHQPKGTEDA